MAAPGADAAEEAFDFFAAVQAPFRMQPGLRRLDVGARQLSPAAPGSRHQREKLAVLGAFADQALRCVHGFDATLALHALATHAAQEHPDHVQWQHGVLRIPSLALEVLESGQLQSIGRASFGMGDEGARCLNALPPPWRLAAALCLAFKEDFAVLDATSGCIPWLAVCLPSFWAPEEKIGMHFTQVHDPVADNRLLLQASSGLTRLVTQTQERWERFVWTITAHPRLHAHPCHSPPGHGWDAHPTLSAHSPASMAQWAHWRTERQTFIPVAGQAQAVFTIHVKVQTLGDALPTAAKAQRLHDALASMSAAVLDYRGLKDVRPALLQWLAERAASPGA
jgi:dimethylamine monooxygenase subunit A